jgi:hypothetical protein
MEALLKLSGLLTEEDAATTDLQTLEKKLAERTSQLRKDKESSREGSPLAETEDEVSKDATPEEEDKTKRDSTGNTSLKPKGKKKDEEVEALSEAMCSLVTNNYGDTRYIGMSYSYIFNV